MVYFSGCDMLGCWYERNRMQPKQLTACVCNAEQQLHHNSIRVGVLYDLPYEFYLCDRCFPMFNCLKKECAACERIMYDEWMKKAETHYCRSCADRK